MCVGHGYAHILISDFSNLMDIPQGSVFGPQKFRTLLGLLRYTTQSQCAFMPTNYKTNYVCQINLGSL